MNSAPDWNQFHTHLSNAERLALIEIVKLEDIVSAPGHRELRNAEVLATLGSKIITGQTDALFAKPILLGIFTTGEQPEVELRCIECLDGHHRLLAGLLAGAWDRLGDLPSNVIETRVNGCRAESIQCEPRWLPLKVVQRSTLKSWELVPEEHGAKGKTAAIAGSISGLDPAFAAADRGVRFAQLERQWRSSEWRKI